MNSSTDQPDPDRIYKPFLRGAFSTRTNYDSSGIEQEYIEQFEKTDNSEA